jgi:hypothetical protein
MREMDFKYDPSTAGSSVRFDPPDKRDRVRPYSRFAFYSFVLNIYPSSLSHFTSVRHPTVFFEVRFMSLLLSSSGPNNPANHAQRICQETEEILRMD